MKNILKRFLLVTQYVIFVLGIVNVHRGIEGKINNLEKLRYLGTSVYPENVLFFGIGLLILGPILKYIFIGQFLIFPWSKEKEGSHKTMKDILKRLLILTHYGIFLFGIMLFIGIGIGLIFGEIVRFNTVIVYIFYGIGTWTLGPTLNYIFLGKFLIFPWSIEKVDK